MQSYLAVTFLAESERQLDTLFAQIGRTEAMPEIASAEIVDSFWSELFENLSLISQVRDEESCHPEHSP